jgi:hypothetical protein
LTSKLPSITDNFNIDFIIIIILIINNKNIEVNGNALIPDLGFGRNNF